MKEATNPVSAIPQSFFDMLARLVPGVTALAAIMLFADKTWSSVLAKIMGSQIFEQPSHVMTYLSFLFCAYVVGQIISPFGKLVQRIGESFGEKSSAPKGAYDWLRFNHPRVGALCAKIRGEFTMHNGLCVVFFVSAIASKFYINPINVALTVLLLVACIVTGIRGRKTRDTFNETVAKFADAAGYRQ